MTQYIEIVFVGPPDIDKALNLVKIVDDSNHEITLGEWYHDGYNWRYQIPVELVPRMKVPPIYTRGLDFTVEQVSPDRKVMTSIGDPVISYLKERSGGEESEAQRQRRALKDRVKSAPRKEPDSMPPNSSPRSEWLTCPSCRQQYDPREHDMISCPQCDKSCCTAVCMPNPVEPCLDCEALNAGPAENGFEPPPRPQKQSAVAPGVFEEGFSPQAVELAKARGLGETSANDEDGDDE